MDCFLLPNHGAITMRFELRVNWNSSIGWAVTDLGCTQRDQTLERSRERLGNARRASVARKFFRHAPPSYRGGRTTSCCDSGEAQCRCCVPPARHDFGGRFHASLCRSSEPSMGIHPDKSNDAYCKLV